MQETLVQSWVQEILEKKWQPPLFLPEITDRGTWRATFHGVTKVGCDLVMKHTQCIHSVDVQRNSFFYRLTLTACTSGDVIFQHSFGFACCSDTSSTSYYSSMFFSLSKVTNVVINIKRQGSAIC